MSGVEIAMAASAALSAAGSIVGGVSANNQAQAQAANAEMQAQEQKAIAQREAVRKGKEARLIQSRQRAVAASSGGGAKDPTIMDLMGDVESEASYQKQAALYEGETRARGLEAEASLARSRGRQSMFSGFIGAGSSILSGYSQFQQYREARPRGGGLYET